MHRSFAAVDTGIVLAFAAGQPVDLKAVGIMVDRLFVFPIVLGSVYQEIADILADDDADPDAKRYAALAQREKGNLGWLDSAGAPTGVKAAIEPVVAQRIVDLDPTQIQLNDALALLEASRSNCDFLLTHRWELVGYNVRKKLRPLLDEYGYKPIIPICPEELLLFNVLYQMRQDPPVPSDAPASTAPKEEGSEPTEPGI